jgi:hypothetical protein
VPLCIFCPNELGQTTKPEHFLLNGLGGRKASRRITCSSCNGAFGDTIDKDLLETVEPLRNMLRLPAGDGDAPPPLKGLQTADGIANFASDGSPRLRAKPFTINKRQDGNIDLQIMAQSEEELAWCVPHIAAKLKCSEEQIWDVIAASTGTIISKRPAPVHFFFPFGRPGTLRCVTKMCLELWTTIAGNDAVRAVPYDAAREFVLHGGEAFARDRLALDSRLIPDDDALKARFGKLFNLIYIASDERGKVIGHFTLYNIVGWRVVLAETGGLPNAKVALISNPSDPRVWSDSIADDININFSWLDTSEDTGDVERARARIIAVAQHYFQTTQPLELGRIIARVFDRQGFVKDEPVPPLDATAAHKIARDISERAVASIFNRPHEEKLSGDKLRSFLDHARNRKR